MLHRVEMNVMQVVFKIFVISNNMIPESFLPKLHGLCGRKSELSFVFSGEIHFEGAHDVAKVALPCWLNNHVEMIEKKNIPQHNEGMQHFDVTKNFTEQVHILRVTKNRFAILNNLRNKNCRARDIITAKIHA